ncbi:Carbonic anhydrase 1 [Candidatus Rubidus massiliensis]|nr:Carbonic anhydrase 1 [Candidatus Rubidus massiliensis]
MRKLIQGIVDFRKSFTEKDRELFANLALEQKPDALFIACSDSRVAPNHFVSNNPGDLFVLRNVGNLIPPYSSSTKDKCSGAVIEFSVHALNVKDIIVCGHSECGAMRAIINGVNDPHCTLLKKWLKYGQGSLKKIRKGITLDPNLSEVNQLSQLNVLQQIENIKSYPFIKERMEKGELELHGWWFEIGHADVHYYDENKKQFVLMDEKVAKKILKEVDH